MSTKPVAVQTETDESRIRRLERMTTDYWRQVTRSGGPYVPPRKLLLETGSEQRRLPEPDSESYQRLNWEALKRSINGLINKVNSTNIRAIVRELIGENLIRGRGLFVRALMRSQAASLVYTPVYAALVAVLNTKFPILGELIAKRLVFAFRKCFARNDKPQCIAHATFIAHLVNQRVMHDIAILQMQMLLLERPTEDSVEIAVNLMKECGATLIETSPRPAAAVFERFRAVLHEASSSASDKRMQFMIEVLFKVRQDGFSQYPTIPPALDLIDFDDSDEDGYTTHYIMLDDEIDTEDGLNLFKVDSQFSKNESSYAEIKMDILGEDSDSESDASMEDDKPEAIEQDEKFTEAELIAFRKQIYLTIMSSMDFEECGHKLLRLRWPPKFELELCHMIVECCSNEKTYIRFFGLLAERFARIDEDRWRANFERCFIEVYGTVHKLDTNRIRNVAHLFGHLLQSDAITWAVFEVVVLTEESTTAASRIFLKFLLLNLAEFFGLDKLASRFNEPDFQIFFDGIFPTVPLDLPILSPDLSEESSMTVMERLSHVRFSVNFFTAIGLGALTETTRLHLEEYISRSEKVKDTREWNSSPTLSKNQLSPPLSTDVRLPSRSPHRHSFHDHNRRH